VLCRHFTEVRQALGFDAPNTSLLAGKEGLCNEASARCFGDTPSLNETGLA
jgi:hypothetical protein